MNEKGKVDGLTVAVLFFAAFVILGIVGMIKNSSRPAVHPTQSENATLYKALPSLQPCTLTPNNGMNEHGRSEAYYPKDAYVLLDGTNYIIRTAEYGRVAVSVSKYSVSGKCFYR